LTGLDKIVEIFVEQGSLNRAFLGTPRTKIFPLIEFRAGHFVEKLGYYLLEEVYFVPPGGGRNPKRV
jgi:hypothetical protein